MEWDFLDIMDFSMSLFWILVHLDFLMVGKNKINLILFYVLSFRVGGVVPCENLVTALSPKFDFPFWT